MAFHPYLFFGGNCREAFTRYQEIFGGELFVMTMKESGEEFPPGMEDMVIHAAITIGDDLLMASDDPTEDGFGPVQGMQVTYATDDPADAKKVFDALAEGGEVREALTKTFFSPAFGMCVDKFGTPWMVSTNQPAPG